MIANNWPDETYSDHFFAIFWLLGVTCYLHLLGNEAYSAPVSLEAEIGLRHGVVPRKPMTFRFSGEPQKSKLSGDAG